jgi:hypothetical protein
MSMNANRGRIAPPVSTSLSTARAPPTVHAAAARVENIPPPLTRSPAQIGHIVQQVSTSQPTALLAPTAHAAAAHPSNSQQ